MNLQELLDFSRQSIMKLYKYLHGKIRLRYRKIVENERYIKSFKIFRHTVLVSCMIAGVILLFLVITPLLQEMAISIRPIEKPGFNKELSEKEINSKIKKLERANINLQRKLDRKTPWQNYLVVNSTINEFFLYRGKKLIRKGVCSTGSYIMLQAADERKWIFKTPRGVFRIQGKVTSPVWIKPDWAFVEDGLPVPSKNAGERYEYGVLGDYAMSLGHGYLIHGTLYQRFLGLPVTHGCIRLGDDDLKAVFHALDIGSKVFIY